MHRIRDPDATRAPPPCAGIKHVERFEALTPLVVGARFQRAGSEGMPLPHQGNDFDRPIAIFIFEAA
jgi:hypothetical protein